MKCDTSSLLNSVELVMLKFDMNKIANSLLEVYNKAQK